MITTELVGEHVIVEYKSEEDEWTMKLSIAEARELLGDLDVVLPLISHEDGIALVEALFTVDGIVTGGRCAMDCGQPIVDGDRDTYTQVTGYVRTQRKGGGANAVALRKPTGRMAHAACVEDEKRGGTGQQRAF